jgi:ABC-type thiamine transport system ATPase subunit
VKREFTKRPGSLAGKERRRVARSLLREFYETEAFFQLNPKYRVAIMELCPVKDSHTERKSK